MKNLIIAVFFLLSLIGCEKASKTSKKIEKEAASYVSFGEKISNDEAISKEEMFQKYLKLNIGDTISVKFESNINEVCKKKGCWIKLNLGDENETMVKFTNYDYFMPLNSADKEVIVAGRAFISEVSVDELKHLAGDAGKSEEEIDDITQPEISFWFRSRRCFNGRIMRGTLLFLTLVFVISCKKEKKEELIMYQPSEMTELMQSIYEYNKLTKYRIEHDQELLEFPVEFKKIHTAKLTDPKEKDAEFDSLASIFIESQKGAYFLKGDSIKKSYNKSIKACIDCHQTRCRGPLPKIEKLMIP